MTTHFDAPLVEADDTPLSRNPLFSFLDQQDELLTAEEECLLARKARSGCARSRDQLVERNLRLVIDLVRRSKPREENELLDRIQAGTIGLIQAIDRFDPNRGFRLSTYATWWIRRAITRERDSQIHTGVPTALAHRLRATERMLADQQGGRQPTIDELAAELRLTPRDVARAQSAQRIHSLDVPIGDKSAMTLGDLVVDDSMSDPAEIVEQRSLREEIEQHLRGLDPTQRRVVELRYGLETGAPETIRTIAERMNLTHDETRRLTERAIRTLQDRVDPPAEPKVDRLQWPNRCRQLAMHGHDILAHAEWSPGRQEATA